MKRSHVVIILMLAIASLAIAVAVYMRRGETSNEARETPDKTAAAEYKDWQSLRESRLSQETHAEPGSSHHQMLQRLRRIALSTADENVYLGDAGARYLRAQLRRLGEDKNDARRSKFLLDLAFEESKLGNEQAAIDLLTQLYEMLPQLKHRLARGQADDIRFRLGVAHLRLGESQNCCASANAESCIAPIRGGGVHTRQEGSRQAIRYFREVLLSAHPNSKMYLKAQWLLNLAYMTIGGYPDEVPAEYRIAGSVFESGVTFPEFKNIAAARGVDTNSHCGGAVVDDFDNDGQLDILVSNFDTVGPLRLFLNQGDGSFLERTRESGLGGLFGGLNMVQADYDNDGDMDVLVLRGAWLQAAGRHPNSLLRNNGDGSFSDVTFDAGLGNVHHPTQTASWADYDLDGDLDVYIGNESAPCQLFRNQGDGTFQDVAQTAGVTNGKFTKGVIWGDFDGDRYPDLYVSNMREFNRLYRNNGDGSFTDVASQLGVVGPRESFPVWFWDFDNDGTLDLYVPSYRGSRDAVAATAASYLGQSTDMEPPALYRGDGQGGFTNVAMARGLNRITLPMGCNFGDLDNDGYLDFYLGTGYPHYEGLVPNVMYRNEAGKRFVDVTFAGGFGHLQKGHAIAFADFDHDGDQDVFAQMGGALAGDEFHDALFENPGFGNHWLSVQLIGRGSNRSAIGARLKLTIEEDGKQRTIYKHVNSGGSFGCNPLRQAIGLGKATQAELQVDWPTSKKTDKFTVRADQAIQIIEGSGTARSVPFH